MNALGAELLEARKALSILHLRALERLGVERGLICDHLRDYGLGVANVTGTDEGLFHYGDGQPHLILPIYEGGELVDLCAFRSAEPKRWLLRSGLGWALGLERGLERHLWSESVPLAVSPLEWLQAGARGLCILDWDAPELRDLCAVPHLLCSSRALATRLRSALTQPAYLPEISVMENRLAA